MRYTVIGFVSNPDLRLEAGIAKERYDSVDRAKDVCLLALGFEERFQLVLDNFHEWEMELLNQAHHHLLWRTSGHNDAMQDRLRLDRHLVNLLTSLRLYLDHTDHGISNIFGNPSAQLDAVKKFKSSLYDNHLGYRLFEALRNHVQHCGLPVHSISYKHSKVDSKKQGSFTQVSVAPQLDIGELAANRGFKASVLKEIQQLGEKIDLRPFAREYITCLLKLHAEIRKTMADILQQNRQLYTNTVEEFSKMDEKAVRHCWFQCSDDSGVLAEKVDLFLEFLTRYDTLHARNSKVVGITDLFASNAAYV